MVTPCLFQWKTLKGNILSFLDEIQTTILWSTNPYRNLKSDNSQDYAYKSQQNCTSMNSASVKHIILSNHALLKKYCEGDLKVISVEYLPQI